ncbi:MAG: PAS domain S-box protein, partial [Desulfobacterales bacterium]|nr:PAS domain S-box protein [Desulfobacterales bacterium]
DLVRRALDRVFSVVCKDGAIKEIEFRGTTLKDDRTIVILSDITERKRAEEAYHAVVEHSLQGLHILQDQREIFANSAYAEMLGYTVEELLALSSKQVTNLVHPDDQDIAWGHVQDRIEGKPSPPHYEFRIIRKDGSVRWVETFPSRIEYQGKPALQVAMIDITERKLAEATLKNSEERYRTLVESSTDAILMLDREKNAITCNQAFLDLTGYQKNEVEGQSIRIVHPSEESFLAYGKATYPLVERVGSLREEWDLKRKDGTIFSAEIVASPIRAPDGTTMGYICIIRDITERKRAEEELEYMATHDSLTGLPNRTLFSDRLSMALTQARRSQKNLAVMLLDLDYFKDVNDTLGHSVGDQLLCAVGDRLKGLLRRGDTIARIGGDEFLLLLPEMLEIEYATTIAQKVLQAFREPFTCNEHQLHITTSIGIALFPDDGENADTLMKSADIAMYRAKNKGRDSFQRYTPA